jgi:hypothetical protein
MVDGSRVMADVPRRSPAEADGSGVTGEESLPAPAGGGKARFTVGELASARGQ